VQPVWLSVLLFWREMPQWHSRAYSRPASGRGGVCERQKVWHDEIVMLEEDVEAEERARGLVSLAQPM
jgi:hypothetical protein